MIVMALRTDGNHRYSRIKNRRSPFVSRTRPRTTRCNMMSCWRSAAFSASSRLFDLSGEAHRVRKRLNSAIIGADARRFGHVIKRTEFSVHTGACRPGLFCCLVVGRGLTIGGRFQCRFRSVYDCRLNLIASGGPSLIGLPRHGDGAPVRLSPRPGRRLRIDFDATQAACSALLLEAVIDFGPAPRGAFCFWPLPVKVPAKQTKISNCDAPDCVTRLTLVAILSGQYLVHGCYQRGKSTCV